MKKWIMLSMMAAWSIAGYALVPSSLTRPLKSIGLAFDAKNTHWQTLQEQYAANKAVWDSITFWLVRHDVTMMKAGAYYICDSTVTIKIQDANTRPESKIEAHRRYIDLQWTFEGTEIYTLWKEKDIEPMKEYNPKKDVQHFNAKEGKKPQVIVSDPKTLYLFFPDQPHQALLCPTPEDSTQCAQPIRKVVVKIPWKQ